MTKDDRAIDEYGKRLLAPLQSTPPMDPQIAASIKEKYLLQGEMLRKEFMSRTKGEDSEEAQMKAGISPGRRSLPWMKVLVGALLALIILIGSSATVYAAQNSLPGDPLYLIKSLSEDIRLSITSSPQSKLQLTLDFTDRRMGEITTLLSNGKDLPNQASERFNGELDSALLLAAQMDDAKMKNALGKIKILAEDQGMSMDKLINQLPEQAEPAIIRLQQRLQEQIEMSNFGVKDPQAFRSEIRERERQLHQHGPNKNSSDPDADSIATPAVDTETPEQPADRNNQNNNHQPSDAPGHNGSGSSQGNPNPGNGNQNANKTPMP
jgi:hypothetical protein